MSRPTRFSTAVVLLGTVGTTAALVSAVGQGRRVAIGAAGALALALALRALASDRLRPVAVAGTGFALPVVGAALLASTGYTVAAQFRGGVPMGSVFLVVGATVAVLGAVTAAGDVLGREPLEDALAIAIKTVFVLAVVLLVVTLGRFAPLGQAATGVLGDALSVVLDPTPGRVHLGVWLGLATLALYGLRRAIIALPVAELLADTLDDRSRRPLSLVDDALVVLSLPLLAGAATALLVELVGDPYQGLSPGLRRLLVDVTSAPGLRWLLWVSAVGSLATVAVVWLLRRSYRTGGTAALSGIAPYVVAAALGTWAVWSATPLVEGLRAELLERLPGVVRPQAREVSAGLVEYAGAPLLAVAVVLLATLAASGFVLALFVVVLLGLTPSRATGAALASGGLFATAAFATAIGAPLWLGLAGIVAAVLVWDGGEFGVTLGRELGREVDTARAEVVHLGGTGVVGVLAVGAALALSAVTGGLTTGSVPVVPALLAALVGAVFLVAASR